MFHGRIKPDLSPNHGRSSVPEQPTLALGYDSSMDFHALFDHESSLNQAWRFRPWIKHGDFEHDSGMEISTMNQAWSFSTIIQAWGFRPWFGHGVFDSRSSMETINQAWRLWPLFGHGVFDYKSSMETSTIIRAWNFPMTFQAWFPWTKWAWNFQWAWNFSMTFQAWLPWMN